jgi:hypothetical protein
MVISVPVTHFNGPDNRGWKRYFQYPRLTYVVGVVEYSDCVRKRHEVTFLGSPYYPARNLDLTDAAYVIFRGVWEKHGQRLIPSYQLRNVFKSDAPAFDFQSPAKKGKRRKKAKVFIHSHLFARNDLYALPIVTD